MSAFAGTDFCPECMAMRPMSAQALRNARGEWVVEVECARCGYLVSRNGVTDAGAEILERYGAAAYDQGIRPFGSTAPPPAVVDESEDALTDPLGRHADED